MMHSITLALLSHRPGYKDTLKFGANAFFKRLANSRSLKKNQLMGNTQNALSKESK
jgi:hypothetical protein